jgi:uncharacterized membrane protein
MFGMVCLLTGFYVIRLIRKTIEEEMVSLVKGVMVSHRVAYSLAFYFCFVGALFILLGVIVD